MGTIHNWEKILVLGFVCYIIFGCGANFIKKSSKYATPEMTLETYKEAILNGDIDAALDCFVEYAKDFQRKRLYDRVIGIKGMKKRIDPVKKIELVRSGIADQHGLYAPTEYKEYRIVTEKGPADWFVLFVKVNGEWKIESLPF